MTTIIYTTSILVGFFANALAASVFGYQQFYCGGLDNAHKALFGLTTFNLLFFAILLIVH